MGRAVGHAFRWAVKLAGELDPSRCTFQCMSDRAVLQLHKVEARRWPDLERNETTAAFAAAVPPKPTSAPVVVECVKQLEAAPAPPAPRPPHTPGVAGLDNIGNTCFMNAILQPLAQIQGKPCRDAICLL